MTMEERMVYAHKLGREMAQVAKKVRGHIPESVLATFAKHMFSYEQERESYVAGYHGEFRRLMGLRDVSNY